jgi:Arc/MetJ-type ribon-helix-helix transcriptional regulator
VKPWHKAQALKPAPQMAIAAPVFATMREAIAVGDYAALEEIVAEALTLWCKIRQHELAALSALSREIEAALSAKKLDARKIAELRAKGRALLGASEKLR